MIGELAMAALPAELPAFLRTPERRRDVGELSPRARPLAAAPASCTTATATRATSSTSTTTARVAGRPAARRPAADPRRLRDGAARRDADSWNAGYLPYAIVDGFQQLAKDFAYWRALQAAEVTRQASRRTRPGSPPTASGAKP